MKKNISVIVVFGLLLAFGMIAASCDNGVLPKYTHDDKHEDGEYEYVNPGLSGPSAPAGPAATYTVDFYNNGTGALGNDGTADVGVTILQSVGDALVAGTGKVMKDPVTLANFKVTFTESGGLVTATKGVATLDAPNYP
jgi:hypothetical protein